MDELISRQAAIDAAALSAAEWDGMYVQDINGRIREALEKLSSAQPEIVRCKECKHYQFADNRAFGMPVKMCEWFGFEDVDDDDFCSRAERRQDG